MIALVDGGCRGNHAHGKREAYASYKIISDSGEAVHVARVALPEAHTNNEAEYRALILLLQDEHLTEGAVVLTDSQLLVGQLETGWAVKAEGLRGLHAQAKALLHEKRIKLVQVPRAEIVVELGH